MTATTETVTEQDAAPALPDWRNTRRIVRAVAQKARREAKRLMDPDLVSVATMLTAIETMATDQTRIATATHRKLLRARLPPLDPADPDGPLDETLAEIWALAAAQAEAVCHEIQAATASPIDETVH